MRDTGSTSINKLQYVPSNIYDPIAFCAACHDARARVPLPVCLSAYGMPSVLGDTLIAPIAVIAIAPGGADWAVMPIARQP